MSGNLREEGLWFQNSDPGLVSESTPFAPGQLGKVSSSDTAASGAVPAGQVPGLFQYVLRYATDTASTPAIGDLAFWQDPLNFVVTAYPALAAGTSTDPIVAGVFAGTALAAGSYGFVQVGGIGKVRVQTSADATTIGSPLVWSTTSFVQQASAVGTTAVNLRPVVGVLLATTTATTSSVSAFITPTRLNW